jgi:hypothetical protein
MLTAPSVRQLASLLAKSFSCDRFPNYPHKKPQCGTCPSCLVRRLAFHSSDLPDDSAQYSTDIFCPRRPLREAQWLSLSKLSVQADSLAACLCRKDPWPALFARWPDLLRTETELSSPAFRDAAIALLRRHVEEWHSFSAPLHNNTLSLAA